MRPAGTERGPTSHDAGREGELGQAATELALVLPLLLLLLLAIAQVTLVARDQILVVHAARAAAREAAVDPRPASVRHEARLAASSLDDARLRVETSPTGDAHPLVTVAVRYRSPTDVPLVGPLLPDVEVRGNAAMRSESSAASANPAPQADKPSAASRQMMRPERGTGAGTTPVQAESHGE